jgi:hypothetical protein
VQSGQLHPQKATVRSQAEKPGRHLRSNDDEKKAKPVEGSFSQQFFLSGKKAENADNRRVLSTEGRAIKIAICKSKILPFGPRSICLYALFVRFGGKIGIA